MPPIKTGETTELRPHLHILTYLFSSYLNSKLLFFTRVPRRHERRRLRRQRRRGRRAVARGPVGGGRWRGRIQRGDRRPRLHSRSEGSRTAQVTGPWFVTFEMAFTRRAARESEREEKGEERRGEEKREIPLLRLA